MGNRSLNRFAVAGSGHDLARLRAHFLIEETVTHVDHNRSILRFDRIGLDDGPAYLFGDSLSAQFPELAVLCLYCPECWDWECVGAAEWRGGRKRLEVETPL